MWAWPPVQDVQCARKAENTFSGGIVKSLIDVILIALPYHLIVTLNMSYSKRFLILSLFSLGGFVVVAGCIRSYYIWKMFFQTDDFSWVMYWAHFWSLIEVYIGVVSHFQYLML
jgi:hypothetical protein